MKKTFLILGILAAFFVTCLAVNAKTNQLHTITLENNNGNFNIVLDTDSISKVTRKVVSDNEIVLELSGITSADTVNALYKGTEAVDNLVIENAGLNKLKIYVSAQNIKNSSVIMNPESGDISLVGESFPADKALWSMFVLTVLGLIIRKSVKRTNEENSLSIKRDIKEREIEMYRKYRRSLDEGISLSSKDTKMNNMLKKIDRKIDERLSVISR